MLSLSVIGLSVVIFGLLVAGPMHDVIVSKINDGVKAYGVLSSTSAGEWPAFINNRDPSAGVITLSFTLFNVTNPEAVLNGARPALAEVGPLRYTYTNTKHNFTWSGDLGELVFYQYQNFVAADDATRALESVAVTQLNTLLAGALGQGTFDAFLPALERVWAAGGGGAFIQRSAKELIWGYEDEALLGLASWPGLQHNDSSLEEALSVHGHVRISTGVTDPLRAMDYIEWAGNDHLMCCAQGVSGEDAGATESGSCTAQYFTRSASAVQGSYGAAFHSAVRVDETLTLATYDFGIYRHWPLQCLPKGSPGAYAPGPGPLYDASPLTSAIGGCDSYDVEGVRLLRFRVPSWALGNSSVPEAVANGETEGYGIDGPSGIMQAKKCFFSAPILYSKAHFLDASSQLVDAVEGVSPATFEEHGSWLGVEPVTGRVLDFSFRIGINAFFEPTTIDGILGVPWTFFAGVTPAVVPLGWASLESTMTPAQGDDFKTKVYTPIKYAAGARWTGVALIALGCVVIAASGLRALMRARKACAAKSAEDDINDYYSANLFDGSRIN